jgi:hypothetical protein
MAIADARNLIRCHACGLMLMLMATAVVGGHCDRLEAVELVLLSRNSSMSRLAAMKR